VKKTAIILAALSLTACTGHITPPEPIIKTVTVLVPGPATPCVPKELGAPPSYVDTDAALRAAKDAAERLQLLFGGRMQRIARLNEVEPVVQSCPRG
jgi:hypothetical protein